ncbi:tyrosine-type recombinase/integrase [Candidatus Nitrospira bockiana]
MATIWKRKDRDVWVVDYRDATGKRIRLTASTRQDAETLMADKIKEAKEPGLLNAAARDLTLKEYTAEWLDRVKGDLEEKTWRSYKQNLERHVVPALGHLKVREITVSHVARLLADKRKARYGKGEGKPYSRTALRLMKASLSSVLTDAVELDGLLKSNPALAITSRKKRNRAGTSQPEANPMTAKQWNAFLAHAVLREQQGLLPYRLRVMWDLRVKTGLRPEEAYALHVGDVDQRTKTLRVERAVSFGRIKPTKTHERRIVDLTDELADLLGDYVDFVKAEALAGNVPEPYWLFPGREGGLVTEADERWHRDLFKQILSAAKLPDFTPYDLRHTFASLLLSNYAPLLYVSKQMGHAKPTTTLTNYAKWVPSGEQRFVNLLDQLSKKVGTKSWHQVDITDGEDSEVLEKDGGPCRDRTYGPLIKSCTGTVSPFAFHRPPLSFNVFNRATSNGF